MPLLFSFHAKLKFSQSWRAFFKANLIVSFIFLAWDIAFTKIGVWGFNARYVCGIYIYNLPLEEVLFFLCIPYSGVFTYHCFRLFLNDLQFPSKVVSLALTGVLVIAALIFITKLYTCITSISLALLLFYISFKVKPRWLSTFYLSYLVILLPFFVVNGLLTGSWIDEPVVWYNNSENMGLRLLTIPVEDIFYGMLLLLLNTWLYESFQQQNNA